MTVTEFIESHYYANPQGILSISRVRKEMGSTINRLALIAELARAGYELASDKQGSVIVGWSVKKPCQYASVGGRLVRE